MSSDLTYLLKSSEPPRGASLAPWIVVALGIAAIYIPSFIGLLRGVWSTERNAHGPIVLAVACAFLYFRIRQLLADGLIEREPAPAAGCVMLIFGLCCFALGQSQTVLFLEAGSLIPVLIGTVLIFFGKKTCYRLWFGFFFMLFMIPLPSSVVDALTQPLKIGVSHASEYLLYAFGYPVARNGVILIIGQYQLLVADACAGLNSLFTLEALGLLYMNLVRHQSVARNTILALLIVPVSFTANTIRVMALALITYYLGDAAGQGFLHGFAGMVLFLTALMLIIGLDGLIRWGVTWHARRNGRRPPEAIARRLNTPLDDSVGESVRKTFSIALKPAIAMALMMLLAIVAARALAPQMAPAAKTAKLEAIVPTAFGDWKAIPSPYMQVSLSVEDGVDGDRTQDQPYDDVLTRTYRNSKGEQVMLALAYARQQQQDVKIHLPQVCYQAQGFDELQSENTVLGNPAGASPINAERMLVRNKDRLEAVSFWVRIGDATPRGGLAMRMKILRDGIGGKISDGMLVRASSMIRDEPDAQAAYRRQEAFLADLMHAVPPGAVDLLAPAR
ncbi:MAG: xrtB [Herbaspirillum sp.]|nr:xrtB [Herbaspirillum sp.]